VTREIISAGRRPTAIDAFAAFYKLAALRRASEAIFRTVDALALPTMPTVYTVEQASAEPILLNSRLGTYTNFVNLLDLCGLALPASMRADGAPFGITLLARAGDDALLATIGRVFHADTGLPLGATGEQQPPLPALAAAPDRDEIAVAVVGAHLSGMALNGELRALGARLLERTQTAPEYRLYALTDKSPPRPGLVRAAARGKAIEVEVWALSVAGFGRLVADVPSPLTIGTLRLADGREAKGFLCEAEAIKTAKDISAYGGWRAYLAQKFPSRTRTAKVAKKRKKQDAPKQVRSNRRKVR
jgi:allophanate hydrolase